MIWKEVDDNGLPFLYTCIPASCPYTVRPCTFLAIALSVVPPQVPGICYLVTTIPLLFHINLKSGFKK
jgi:hypothetical protein